jgi:hypothetical protein
LPDELDGQLKAGGLHHELRRLILAKRDAPPSRYPFVGDIVGNTICADLLDYLERDHRETGLPIALGRRFVSAFYIMPSGDPDIGEHMILHISRPDGRERTDVVTEVLKYLRYRYELSERALVHHAKLSADAMTGKALEMWYDVAWVDQARTALMRRHRLAGKPTRTFRMPRWLLGTDIGGVRARYEREHGRRRRRFIDQAAKAHLDEALSSHGDDALLEQLAQFEDPIGPPSRAAAVRRLSRAILDRELFKPIGTQHRPLKSPAALFAQWGSPEARRGVEEDAASWAGLDHRWQVLLWVPPETMRLKIADVLVDDGSAVMTFYEYEERGRGRGRDIYAAHKALWAISVYLDPGYAADELTRKKVIARIAKTMNVTFTQYEEELGRHAHLWPDQVAAKEAASEIHGAEVVLERPQLVSSLMEQVRTAQVPARGAPADESWEALLARYRAAAVAISGDD